MVFISELPRHTGLFCAIFLYAVVSLCVRNVSGGRNLFNEGQEFFLFVDLMDLWHFLKKHYPIRIIIVLGRHGFWTK
jgi:hypothetical protein